jgi:hypothetical protein
LETENHIDHEVKRTTEVTIQNAKFVSLTCDEVISMDHASWANVHGYIVQNWCHILLLLNVQHVVFGSKVNNLTLLTRNLLMTQGEFDGRGVCFKVSLFWH